VRQQLRQRVHWRAQLPARHSGIYNQCGPTLFISLEYMTADLSERVTSFRLPNVDRATNVSAGKQ
jgi:hypothetical protein